MHRFFLSTAVITVVLLGISTHCEGEAVRFEDAVGTVVGVGDRRQVWCVCKCFVEVLSELSVGAE
jgi:hypothetical protein